MKDYTPYTEEEYIELKNVVDAIGAYIPNDKMNYIWNNYKKITGSRESTPCSCGSAASHWRRAVDEIRNFITKVEG
jgi:hypothetical protein